MTDLKTLKKMIYQILYILDSRQRVQMVGIFLIILLGSFMELLGVSAILPFIQAIMTPDILRKNPAIARVVDFAHITSDTQLIIAMGVLIILVYIVKNIYLSWSAYIQARYNCTTQKDLSLFMYKMYMERPYEYFSNSDSGQILRGINGDSQSLYIVIQHIFKFSTQIVTIIAITIYLFLIDVPMAAGVVALGGVCFGLIVIVTKRKMNEAGNTARLANAETSDWAVQTISGIKDIFVFDKRDYAIEKYDNRYKKQVKANIFYDFICAVPTYLIEMICASGIILILIIKVWLGNGLASFIPKLSVFAMAAFKLLPAIAAASGYVSVFVYHRPSVDAAYENIKNAREFIAQRSMKSVFSGMEIAFKDEIRIENLLWRYGGRNSDTLRNLCMTIKKGDSVGIIGESGAGKSTLADILLNLYTPQKGTIYMDGIDVSTIEKAWNHNLSYVPQSVFLFNDTIKSNVCFGDKNVPDEIVWKILEDVSLKEFVESLPEGLDTVVGERGIRFSGGQRQRLAIARALYSNPNILILDEATSALDNGTENAIMEAIERLQGRLTLIIIAHRLTTIRKCNKVYEIKDGMAIERRKDDVFLN